jgi:3',5'-cyclic AMP phosphodiesterase CpdA
MAEQNSLITRRTLIGNSILAAAALSGGCAFKTAAGIPPKRKRIVRFAHLTDIHMEPEHNAPEGLTAALRHIEAMADKPDMVITGGDNVMDVLGADDHRANILFSLVKQIFHDHCSLPVKYCIGNHDVWGWNKKDSKTTGNEPLWGKKRAVEEFALANRYYAFDQGPWRIFMLDSPFPCQDVYTARLDDEQFDWLAAQLGAHSDKFICINSHIPIISAAALLHAKNEKTGDWLVPHQLIHSDARKIVELFIQHKNVKLCISGHLHMLERIDYHDVAYICDGAVCGAWWGGAFRQCQEGYGVFDLFEDGTFDHQYIDYGWTPEKTG